MDEMRLFGCKLWAFSCKLTANSQWLMAFNMQDFRKLEVWQRSHELTLKVYELTRSFPADEKFGLTSQLRRAAVSVELNLAEGSSRGSDPDFRRFVQMAIGSASEVECQLLLARDLKFLPEARYKGLESEVQQIKRMLIRLTNGLGLMAKPLATVPVCQRNSRSKVRAVSRVTRTQAGS
ncbi:MAG: four helix bundle protein [Verrucomicrobiia bacterium]